MRIEKSRRHFISKQGAKSIRHIETFQNKHRRGVGEDDAKERDEREEERGRERVGRKDGRVSKGIGGAVLAAFQDLETTHNQPRFSRALLLIFLLKKDLN